MRARRSVCTMTAMCHLALRRPLANLLQYAVLAGCASSVDDIDFTGPRPNLIQFSPMFSAFDGTHSYAVTPSVPYVANSMASDPVMASSIQWEVDTAFVEREEFPELTAAIKLTTKKAGVTAVIVRAKSLSGKSISSRAKLAISQAHPEEWAAGERRYNTGETITWAFTAPAADGDSPCEPPHNVELPQTSACGNCHNATSAILPNEYTPTQTAGYSNEDLINIFANGAKPARETYSSAFLRKASTPDCIHKTFHTWQMTEEEKNGLIWHLRAIPPKAENEFDLTRLTPGRGE